jgi:hypothetical protein
LDIITIVQAVFRRWYISFPLVAVAAVAAFYIQSNTPPAYQAEGQLLLADPSLDPSGLPASVVDVDEILRLLDEPSVREDLESGDAVYQVEAEDQSTFVVTVSAPGEQTARSTALAIRDWVTDHVESQQAEAGFPDPERLQVRGGERVSVTTDTQTGTGQAGSVITLFDPTAGFVNPYVASIMTVRLLIVAVESDAGRGEVLQRTGTGVGFLLTQSPRDAAPIMGVTTTGSDPSAVLSAFDAVRQVVDVELQQRQDRAEIPLTRRTRVEALATPQRVTDVSPPVERAAAAIFGLGGLLAVAAAIAVDGIQTRRRSRSSPQWPPLDAPLRPYDRSEREIDPDSAVLSPGPTPDAEQGAADRQ